VPAVWRERRIEVPAVSTVSHRDTRRKGGKSVIWVGRGEVQGGEKRGGEVPAVWRVASPLDSPTTLVRDVNTLFSCLAQALQPGRKVRPLLRQSQFSSWKLEVFEPIRRSTGVHAGNAHLVSTA